MKLILQIFPLIALIPFLSSCSVYTSTGRKGFESKAAQNNVHVSNARTSATEQETCWEQPSNEPLWNLEESATMSVTKINEDEIQVCTLSQQQ